MSKVWSGALACLLLCALPACGDDDSKRSSRGAAGEGSGGDGPGGDGRGGDSPRGDGGRPSTSEPGDYDSYWIRATAEILVVDPTTVLPQQTTFEYPGKVTDRMYDVEAEVFEQIDGGELVVYTHYDESEVYFRLRLPLLEQEDGYYRTTPTGFSIYSLKDGALELMQTQASGETAVIGTTYYEKYTGDFPPPDWPSTVVDVAPTEVVP